MSFLIKKSKFHINIMLKKGYLLGILLANTFFLLAQDPPIFYSEPEPVHMVNSPDGEAYLYLSADDSELIFTKEKSKRNVGGVKNPGDIWFAHFLKSNQIDSAKTQRFNAKNVFNAPIGYNQDGTLFYYSETEQSRGIYQGRVMQMSTSDGFKSEVAIPYYKNQSPIQTGYISRDGQYMILSLETKAGYGVEDLYVSINENGRWTSPINLGFTINSDKQELTPFLSEDNRTLYFATNARGGKGSFDIYYATRMDNSWRNWSEPKNLGGMINSEGAETSFMFNAGSDYAYFVSTQNSDGYGDVKRIRIFPTDQGVSEPKPEPKVAEPMDTTQYARIVSFRANNAKTGSALAFNFIGSIYSSNGKEKRLISESETDQMKVGMNAGDFLSLEFKSKGFLSETVELKFADMPADSSEQIIELQPLETGNVITLKNVLFQKGTDNLLDNSERSLDLVVEMMNDNPEVNILLKGHTDNVGNKVLNIQLSQIRVNKVKEYLVSSGIDAKRISGIGYGGSKPIADNRTEETRKPNRRVEFEVLR